MHLVSFCFNYVSVFHYFDTKTLPDIKRHEIEFEFELACVYRSTIMALFERYQKELGQS